MQGVIGNKTDVRKLETCFMRFDIFHPFFRIRRTPYYLRTKFSRNKIIGNKKNPCSMSLVGMKDKNRTLSKINEPIVDKNTIHRETAVLNKNTNLARVQGNASVPNTAVCFRFGISGVVLRRLIENTGLATEN